MPNTNKNGRVIYRGPSLFDGTPIVAIVTGLATASTNSKTGGMLQVHILRDEGAPLSHVQSGTDAAICGTCRYRANAGCYVQAGKAQNGVHRCYARGGYAHATPAEIPGLGAGRAVRLGAYGDPAAVPVGILRALVSQARLWTGYTHAWKISPDLKGLCMASVDTPEEFATAQAAGWRTFRVDSPKDWKVRKGEILCPASAEAGHRTTCADCGLCAGTAKVAKSIMIPAHGAKKNRAAVAQAA